MIPVLMVVLNILMFAVALPTIRTNFDLQADVASWLATAYTAPFMIFMPLYGRLGDGMGKRRLLMIGVTIFLIGTAIALTASTLWLLFVGRVIQGMGAGGVHPGSMAIISDLFLAKERGKALGTWNTIGPIAGIVAPLLGGFIVDHLGWRIIFVPVILVGLLALLGVWRLVPGTNRDFVQSGFLTTFDWGGVGLLATATATLIFYLSSRPITGVPALQDWRLLGGSLLLFGGFIWWERRQTDPFLDLAILSTGDFSRAGLGVAVRMAVMSGIIGFLMPLYLDEVRGLSADRIGFFLTLHAIALLVTMRLGGQLADQGGSRWPVMSGAAGQVLSMAFFALLPQTATQAWIIGGLAMHGLAAGLSLAALHRASMGEIPPEQNGAAAGLYNMMRFGGSVVGIALAGVVLQQGLDWSVPTIEAYQAVFWFLTGVAALGVVIGWGLRQESAA
jgi:EmrB/QacA subfamily drug resistance transporter